MPQTVGLGIAATVEWGIPTIDSHGHLISSVLVAPSDGAIMAPPDGATAPSRDGSERVRSSVVYTASLDISRHRVRDSWVLVRRK